MSIESLQIQGIIPILKEEKKSWNAKEKNCSKCDSKHICVECVCQECGTVNLDTMICGCRPKEEWKEQLLGDLRVAFPEVFSKFARTNNAEIYLIEKIESLLATERARIAEAVKEMRVDTVYPVTKKFSRKSRKQINVEQRNHIVDAVLSLLQTP